MKKLITVLMVFAAITGCKKSTNDLVVQSLYGTWELRTLSGGIAGISTTLPAGNSNIITLGKDRHYTWVSINGTRTTTDNGNFWLSTITYTSSGQKTDILNLQNNIGDSQYEVTIRNDTLRLYPYNIADGFTTGYVRR